MWSQNYTPLGGVFLSALVAALPVVVLLALLAVWHVRAQWAALCGLSCAAVVALFIYHMPPALVAASAAYGAAFGLFPIGWIVLNAIFLYELSVRTGQFDLLRKQIAELADDRRIQALLIAFSFGAFIEGCAGFGAPVAITGAMLVGLGFKPLEAAKLALIGNTAPVAFGSLGIPLTTLNSVTGLDLHALSAMVGRQLPIFSMLIPFWLIAAQAGWRGMVQVWPACLVCGISFASVQFLVSNLHGPWLVDLASSVASMLVLVALLRWWKPDAESGEENGEHPARNQTARPPSPPSTSRQSPINAVGEGHQMSGDFGTHAVSHAPLHSVRAWLPWLLLSAFVALWSVKEVKAFLTSLAPWKFPMPLLHGAILRMPPVVLTPKAEEVVFKFELLAATGTALLCAGITAGLLLGVGPAGLVKTYGAVFMRVRISLLTIVLMLALGFTTRFSGSDTSMGLAFASTGVLFPFFSPLLGWLGVALTGSDTSSNVLFGNLQQVTAQQVGIPPILTAAANSSGGVMGKMIDAQSIVVASVAAGSGGSDLSAGTILRAVFWHSLALALLVGLLVLAQAYWFPQMIAVG